MKEFYKEITKLKTILRRGWKFRKFKTTRYESDAEHTYSMLMLAYFIIEKNNVKDLDIYKVLRLILFHELGEIEIGDLTPFDNYNVNEKHLKEREFICKFAKRHDVPEILKLWDEYNKQDSKEAKFVKMLDQLDFLCQAYSYKDNNEKQFDILYDEYCIKHPDIIKEFNKYGN